MARQSRSQVGDKVLFAEGRRSRAHESAGEPDMRRIGDET
jgi:hypothetical protein